MEYLPYFISMIVLCGIIVEFCSGTASVNDLIAPWRRSQGAAQRPLRVPAHLRPKQPCQTGVNSIKYMAAMRAIDTIRYDAAYVAAAGQGAHVARHAAASCPRTSSCPFSASAASDVGNE
jgi:putative aldouronate transport system permease protein